MMDTQLDFDKLQKKVTDLKDRQYQLDADQDDVRKACQDARAKIKALQDQRAKLDQEEQDLKTNLEQNNSQIKQMDALRKQQDQEYKDLMVQYDKAKLSRNKKLVGWLMNQYGDLDAMNLTQAKDFLAEAVLSQREESILVNANQKTDGSDDDSATGNQTTGGDDEDLQADHDKLNEDKKSQASQALKAALKAHEANQKSTQAEEQMQASVTNKELKKLGEQQRIYGNRQSNDPIDTVSEAEDTEELASPYGTRNIDQELSDYAKDYAKSHPEKGSSASEVAKRFQNEFDL